MPALPIHSDPAFRELVDRFVAELPGRVSQIRAAVDSGDRETSQRLAHQLKGAGGGYGFEGLSHKAGFVERLVVEEKEESAVAEAIDRLAEECARAAEQNAP